MSTKKIMDLEEPTKPAQKMLTLMFDVDDIEGILELLSWAQSTATYLAKLEDSGKVDSVAARKLATLAVNANTLIKYIAKSVDTGEPDFDIVN